MEDYVQARASAIQHATELGEESVCIMLGRCCLFHKRHGNIDVTHYITEEEQYAMWAYLERLSKRYAHVYVPPLGWPGKGHINTPVIPSVAVYRTEQVNKLRSLQGPLGFWLTAEGYDSFTVSDYFFNNLGVNHLYEKGDASTWSIAHGRAIDRLL